MTIFTGFAPFTQICTQLHLFAPKSRISRKSAVLGGRLNISKAQSFEMSEVTRNARSLGGLHLGAIQGAIRVQSGAKGEAKVQFQAGPGLIAGRLPLWHSGTTG